MKNIQKLVLSVVTGLLLFSFTSASTSSYKCMVQLQNYKGYGAYVIASVIDADGNYQETIQVLGDEERWHEDLPAWWEYRESVNHNPDVDAVTGASIQAGNRTMFSFDLDDKYIDNGYTLRFESAVENQEYYKQDLELELTRANLKGKYEGEGYIRYVRIMPAK